MRDYYNQYLNDNLNISEEKIKSLENKFKLSVELVGIIFGKNSFRRYSPAEFNDEGFWAVKIKKGQSWTF